MTTEVRLGMQGWGHPAWIGQFYPPGMERCDMLRRYGREFTTVEIADTFWGVPPEPSVRGWHDAVPDEFSFALRVPQQVTHDRRFRDTGPVLGRFLARVSLLGGKLGPLLLTSPRGFQPTTENRQALRAIAIEPTMAIAKDMKEETPRATMSAPRHR